MCMYVCVSFLPGFPSISSSIYLQIEKQMALGSSPQSTSSSSSSSSNSNSNSISVNNNNLSNNHGGATSGPASSTPSSSAGGLKPSDVFFTDAMRRAVGMEAWGIVQQLFTLARQPEVKKHLIGLRCNVLLYGGAVAAARKTNQKPEEDKLIEVSQSVWVR